MPLSLPQLKTYPPPPTPTQIGTPYSTCYIFLHILSIPVLQMGPLLLKFSQCLTQPVINYHPSASVALCLPPNELHGFRQNPHPPVVFITQWLVNLHRNNLLSLSSIYSLGLSYFLLLLPLPPPLPLLLLLPFL